MGDRDREIKKLREKIVAVYDYVVYRQNLDVDSREREPEECEVEAQGSSLAGLEMRLTSSVKDFHLFAMSLYISYII